jgi:tRNA threonylcarbamoyl adenosine modification protein YeaZ
MHALLIDTATEKGVVAILKKDVVLYHVEFPYGFNHSQHLMPAIAESFDAVGLQPRQLDYIALGVGPGSYTGIRVAASAAKTFAFSCQIPLVGICSLEGFVPQRESSFAALIDAKMSGVYALKGTMKGGKAHYLSEPQVLPMSLAGDFLKEIRLLVTPQSARIRQQLTTLFPQKNWEWQESSPSVHSLAMSAYDKYQKGLLIKDDQIELMYLRKTQAEIEREKKAF